MELINILTLIMVILIFVILILAGIYCILVFSAKQKAKEKAEDNTTEKKEENTFNGLSKESIYSFMEFDEIKDSMIVRKNGAQYVMAIQCQGVNFDLLSEQEKIAVEEGFVQLLNTLRFPIQLYIQTRSLNLREILDEYKNKIKDINSQIEHLDIKIKEAKSIEDEELVEKLEFEKRRKNNILEYGTDITEYVSRLSANKNVLQQKTYIIVSYYASEFGETNTYGKDEISNICFSELYTRCQNIIRLLATSSVTGRILDSEELAELLYVAYNRDASESLQLSRALDAQYDALYSTSKDVLEKRKEELNMLIEEQAMDIVTDVLVDSQKNNELTEEEKLKLLEEKSLELLEEYRDNIDPEIYEEAVKEVKKRVKKSKKNKTV